METLQSDANTAMRPGKYCSLHVTHLQGIVKSELCLKLKRESFEDENSVNPAQCCSFKRDILPRPLFSLDKQRHSTLVTMPCRCVTCGEQFLAGRIAVFSSQCCHNILEMLPGLGIN